MKLSEYILKQKKTGCTRAVALERAKKVVKACGHPWTEGKDKVFDDVWPVSDPHLQKLHEMFATFNMKSPISKVMPFYRELWKYYNAKFFNNELPSPTFDFLKRTTKVRAMACYINVINVFKFHPRLFNRPFEGFCDDMIHEMCHQAVHCIDKGVGYIKSDGTRDIHGEPWKKWMRHCGQKPERVAKIDSDEFMDVNEKAEHNKKMSRIKKETEGHVKLKSPTEGQHAQYFSPSENKWVKGTLVCQEAGRSKRWVLANVLSSNQFKVVAENLLYVLDPVPEAFSGFQWRDYIAWLRDAYRDHHERKKKENFAKRIVNNRIRGGYSNFDVTNIPVGRRGSYALVVYVLTKTRAKEGKGSFNVAEMMPKKSLFSKEQIIEALNWMQQVDGGRYVSFSTTAGLNSLSLSVPLGSKDNKYTLADFQDSVYRYYDVIEG